MARENYAYIKKQKELANKKKKEERRLSKLAKKNAQVQDAPGESPDKDIPVVE